MKKKKSELELSVRQLAADKRALQDRVVKLDNLVAALRDVIAWYETEHERHNRDDDEIPEELREAEEQVRNLE